MGAKEFKKALRVIFSGRGSHVGHDSADLNASGNVLELVSTGTSTEIDATIRQAGYARVPLEALERVKKIAATFDRPNLHLRIEPGRFRIESASVGHADIEMKTIGRRIADLPMNATPLDTIALLKIFSAEEIAESGLSGRVVEAQENIEATVESAVKLLKCLEVPKSAVMAMIEEHVVERAKVLKGTLLRSFPEQET